jgi:putative transposase
MAKRTTERAGQPRRYTFKLYTSRAQDEVLFAHARMMAELWNGLLQRNEDRYHRMGGQKGVTHIEGNKLLGYEAMTYDITDLRRECPEWAAMLCESQRRVANALADAYKAFFRRFKELSSPAVYEVEAAKWKEKKRRNPNWLERNPTRFDLAGYPKYRALARANWVPHRIKGGAKAECKLMPQGCARERPNGRKSACNWRLTLKGVPGAIRARGEFPEAPLAWSDADLRHKDGIWWLSVAVENASPRDAGRAALTLRFDLIDRLAEIAGADIVQPDFSAVAAIQNKIDELKSERDRRWPWPQGKARPQSRAYDAMCRRIGKLSAREVRLRRELLHEWTTLVVSRASSLTIIKPPVKDATRTARGNHKEWGGAVDLVAALNRKILSQAPASVVQMLEYKAKEAGIPCEVVTEERPVVAVGALLSKATKSVRGARRQLKKV